MRHENAAERVRRRIAEWVKTRGHGSRKELATAVAGLYGKQRSSAWATDVVEGKQDLRLRDLDGVARALGTQPGDLVRHDDNLYAEVTHTEWRVLRFYRSLPDVARHHLVGYFDYLFGLQQKVLEAQAQERDERTAETKRIRARELREEKHRHAR